MKKGLKSGVLKRFEPILHFYTKNSPPNSGSMHVMITFWNQKSQNVGTLCSNIPNGDLKNPDKLLY